MCGILAFVANKEPLPKELELKVHELNHRGPDDFGVKSYENAIIAQTRLAIIDVENGKQPMTSPDGRYCISFNGEIYNFKYLREKIKRKGYKFTTESDTEVVLLGFISFGIEFLPMLRGMFAIAIWDNEKEEILVARDEFGIKPCYFSLISENLSIASELHLLKSRELKINKDALPYYFQTGFIPSPLTIYENVYKLNPGHYFTYSPKSNNITQKLFYKEKNSERISKNNLSSNQVWQSILETVEKHLISDVPFGAFLSGGIDSTIVCMAMKEILGNNFQTFSIGFENPLFDESNYVKEVVNKLGISNELHFINGDEVDLNLVESIIHNFGEPFGDSSIVPTYQVSKLASKHVKMALSGDGGDEIFAGYPHYFKWNDNSPYNYLKTKFSNREIVPFIRGLIGYSKRGILKQNNIVLDEWMSKFSSISKKDLDLFLNFQPKTVQTIFEESHKKYSEYDRLDYALAMDLRTNLPGHLLPKVDITGMMNGLEVRTPFVDKNFYNTVKELKSNALFDKNQKLPGKKILKEILSNNFDEEFLYRKKQGFSMPKSELFSKNKIGWDRIIKFSETEIFNELFNQNQVLELLERHHLKSKDNSEALWYLLVFSIWIEQNYVN